MDWFKTVSSFISRKFPTMCLYPETVNYQITLHDFLTPGYKTKESANKELEEIFRKYRCIPFYDVYL